MKAIPALALVVNPLMDRPGKATDVATPGHTLVDLWASWQQRAGQGSDLLWFAKLGNAGNALAYNASTLRTARELSPAGARALQLGLRLAF